MDITITEAKTIATAFCERTFASDNGANAPIFIHSSPGIGKSAIMRQIAKNLKADLRDVRLASLEPSDVNGIPYVSHAGAEDELMKFSTPSWFPTDPNSKGILFFDEISNAVVSTQHAAYRVIMDRQINNGKYLPPGWQIVAAGNLKTDKTGAKNVVAALANRFATHLHVRADNKSFLMYAMASGIHPHVIGFMGFAPAMLHMMPKDDSEAAFPSPRTWEYVSNHLKLTGLKDEELIPVIAGCVGEKVGVQFASFRKYYGKLPNFEEIMDGKMEYTVPKNDLGVLWAVCSSLVDCALKNHDQPKRMKNLAKVVRQLDDDFLVLFFKSMKQGDNKVVTDVLLNMADVFNKVIGYVKTPSA